MWAIITCLVTSYIVGIWSQDSSSLLHVLNRYFLFDSVKFILDMDKKHYHVMSAGLVIVQWLSIVFMPGW